MAQQNTSNGPIYEPHETPPLPVTVGLSLQFVLVSLGHIVLYPLVVTQAAGLSAEHSAWILFASLLINGLTTVLQTVRFGFIGSGSILISIPSTISIPFIILALLNGGPGTLISLVIVSAVFQVAVTARLSMLRRIITPTVDGTVMMLMMITLLPIMLGQVNDVPAGTPAQAMFICAGATFIPMMAILLKSTGQLRMWAPVIAIALGIAAAIAYGIYDFEFVKDSPWVGFPTAGWPGLRPEFGNAFWTLLPVFLVLSVVSVAKGSTLALTAQRISWRDSRAIDFRKVQGGVISGGLGSLVSGLIGGLPVYIGTSSSSVVLQTGCASRAVGILLGILIAALAFFPKIWSLLAAVPGPVAGMYLFILTAPLFVEGIRTIAHEELDYRKSLIVGIALAIGLGFEFEVVSFPLEGLWGPLLQKGLTAGGITVVLLALYLKITGQKRRRIQVDLDVEELPRINAFLRDFATRRGWQEAMAERLQAASEETLLILSAWDQDRRRNGRKRHLTIMAGRHGQEAELEFISAPLGSGNLEDKIALLKSSDTEMADLSVVERDAPIRLLQHYAASVSHRQYQETQVITLRISPG